MHLDKGSKNTSEGFKAIPTK